MEAAGAGDDDAAESAESSPGRIVMTAGRTQEWFGYRVYDTIATSRDQQVVVAHDGVTGEVAAIAVGSELGAYRTGALGGVALRELVRSGRNASTGGGAGGERAGTGRDAVGDRAPGDDSARDTEAGLSAARPVRLAIVGVGRQAWTQLWAATGVLDIADARVVSRTPATAKAFCERATSEFGILCAPVDSVRDAARGADVVILATSSLTPVVEATWIEPDCVVVTLGPKQVGRAEFALDLLDGAFVTTDSVDQLHAYDPPALASARGTADVVALGDVLTGRVEAPAAGRRVHLSVGLAGTEVALLAAMAAADRRREFRPGGSAPHAPFLR